MSATRIFPTAVLLQDGRVLVAGGMSGPYLSSAELFDPATSQWRSIAPMHQARMGSRGIRLRDGRVLMVGGSYSDGELWDKVTLLDSAELFDPSTEAWAPAAPMAQARLYPWAFLLRDGKVLVLGRAREEPAAEVYDPARNTWSALAVPVGPDDAASAVQLSDGRIYIDRRDGTATWFDPRTGRSEEAPHRAGTARATLVRLSDDRILAPESLSGRQSEVFSPALGAWTPVGGYVQPRDWAALVQLLNGKLLAVGGATWPEDWPLLATTEVFDPTTERWTYAGQMGIPRLDAAAVGLEDGRVLVVGGRANYDYPRDAELYDPTCVPAASRK